jgi:hypothetical protein
MATLAREQFPESVERAISTADQACDHVFDLLGSGPISLGKKIDWHADFKTGWRWEPVYYTDVDYLDLMQPYRLEMGTALKTEKGKNLYEFWGDDITRALNTQLKKSGSPVLVNLASNEYFRSVRSGALDGEIITPVFKDLKGDKYKVISFYAKKARGQMARFIIDKELNDPQELKKFRVDGYRYNRAESSAREPVFTRDVAPAAK